MHIRNQHDWDKLAECLANDEFVVGEFLDKHQQELILHAFTWDTTPYQMSWNHLYLGYSPLNAELLDYLLNEAGINASANIEDYM